MANETLGSKKLYHFDLLSFKGSFQTKRNISSKKIRAEFEKYLSKIKS